MKDKAKIGILSLGCPRNIVDSESILGRLRLKGHAITDISKADVAIVNSCSFIEEAKKESIDAILDLIELKKSGKLKRIIIYGCLPQRYGPALRKELPEIDAFVGRVSLNHSQDRFAITARHYAYLKICESCVNNCSFCVIPKIKGRFSSLELDSALKKVKMLEESGVSELNIIGQDITAYGLDLYGTKKLTSLLGNSLGISRNIGWFRLLYLHPARVDDELLKLMRDNPRVVKYIDLPLQHINDRILKLMNRGTGKKYLLKLIDRIRKILPGAALRTSLIVGFPSETDKEFKELLDFINEVKFERLGAFIYSREEGTGAFNFEGQVPRKTKVARFNCLMSAQQEISKELNARFLNKAIDVLIDEKEGGHYLGRSQYDAPEVDGTVFVKSKRALRPGEFVKVKITDTLEYDLTGEAL